jgi:competence protein ComEC
MLNIRCLDRMTRQEARSILVGVMHVLARFLALFSGLRHAIAQMASEEHERWPLWLPVSFGAGIAAYFSLRVEPAIWIAPLAGGMLLPLLILIRRRPGWLMAMALAAAAIAGFGLSKWRADSVIAPVIDSRLGPTMLEGRVVSLDINDSSRRVVLDSLSIARLPMARTPARVRLRINGTVPPLHAGDRISVRAVLLPPPPPAAPGA